MMENIWNIRMGLFLGNILSLLFGFGFVILIFAVLIIAGIVVVAVLINKKHMESDYYKQTGKDIFDLSSDKGSSAEFKIGKGLEGITGYKKFIYNCYIPKSNGGTTEIDVLMIHEKGLFVIESKNYSGWIFGNEDQTQWTQVLKSGRYSSQKNHFYNPIKQNTTHVKWLEKYLEPLNFNIPFYSVIVFGNSCELKNITITSNRHAVMNEFYLFDAIQKHVNESWNVFNCEQIDQIYEKLFALTQVSDEEKLEHIHSVNLNKEKINTFNNSQNNNSFHCDIVKVKEENKQNKDLCDKKCPKCGADLVLRTVKNGERAGQKFLGCSNYPKCRHTEKM